MAVNPAIPIHILGSIGAIVLLISYVLVSRQRVKSNSFTYQMLNLTGSILLMINGFYFGAYPSGFLNIIWGSVAILELWRINKKIPHGNQSIVKKYKIHQIQLQIVLIKIQMTILKTPMKMKMQPPHTFLRKVIKLSHMGHLDISSKQIGDRWMTGQTDLPYIVTDGTLSRWSENI